MADGRWHTTASCHLPFAICPDGHPPSRWPSSLSCHHPCCVRTPATRTRVSFSVLLRSSTPSRRRCRAGLTKRLRPARSGLAAPWGTLRSRGRYRPEAWWPDGPQDRSCGPDTLRLGAVPRAKYSVTTRVQNGPGSLPDSRQTLAAINPDGDLNVSGLSFAVACFMKRAHSGTAISPANPLRDDRARLVEANPHARDQMRRESDEPRIHVVVGRAGLARRRQREAFLTRLVRGAVVHDIGQHARHQEGGLRRQRPARPTASPRTAPSPAHLRPGE